MAGLWFTTFGPTGGVVVSEGGVCGFGSALGDSSSSLSRSRSLPGRKASRSFSTLSSVGVHLEKPALFCSQTTSVPCADFTFNSALQDTVSFVLDRVQELNFISFIFTIIRQNNYIFIMTVLKLDFFFMCPNCTFSNILF